MEQILLVILLFERTIEKSPLNRRMHLLWFLKSEQTSSFIVEMPFRVLTRVTLVRTGRSRTASLGRVDLEEVNETALARFH